MKIKGLFAGALVATMAFAAQSQAGTIPFSVSGGGITASGSITYGPDPVLGDPANAVAITNITGTFSDSNVAISNATITGIVPISPVVPLKGSPFPNSFSFFAALDLPPPDTAISYDNLLYLDGAAPIVCPDYPGAGGYFDTYGVLFTLDNGDTVDLYSNGTAAVLPPLSYGALVVDATDTLIDNQGGGLTASVPEPASLLLLGSFLLGAAALRRR